jgi:hypothetical protein
LYLSAFSLCKSTSLFINCTLSNASEDSIKIVVAPGIASEDDIKIVVVPGTVPNCRISLQIYIYVYALHFT